MDLYMYEYVTDIKSGEKSEYHVYPSSLTSMTTTTLAIKMKVMLNARSSRRDRGRQPLSLQLSTAGGV